MSSPQSQDSTLYFRGSVFINPGGLSGYTGSFPTRQWTITNYNFLQNANNFALGISGAMPGDLYMDSTTLCRFSFVGFAGGPPISPHFILQGVSMG